MFRHPTARVALLLALSAFLAACAAKRGLELPEFPDWETRRAVLQSLERWEFTGRIGVRTGDDGFNGKLRWRQGNDDFRATVSGPLGAGTVRIESDGAAITLTDKDGIVTELRDAELDLQLRYGWTIPVASLRYWALGIPDPTQTAVTEFDTQGRLNRLQQRDWQVSINDYREGGGQPMPRRITAVNGEARVRLVIDRWTFL